MKFRDFILARFRPLTGSGPREIRAAMPSEVKYYEDLFVRNADWNTASPNPDEMSRWIRIKAFLDRYLEKGTDKRILDVGCGRGWLTNLLSQYGSAMGIEPVPPVIEYARRLFPSLRFEVGTPETFDPSLRFDAVVSTEVLEHVVEKLSFLRRLRALVKPGGILIVTTPRGELYDKWTATFGKPAQPIEEWITTDSLIALLRSAGFEVLESATAFSLEIYQIHICRPLIDHE